MRSHRHRLTLAGLALLCSRVHALNNGVGLTPAMGWNSWNRFRCEGLDEKLILEVAEAMVSSGLRDAGYVYVNIDDCWVRPSRALPAPATAREACPPAAHQAHSRRACALAVACQRVWLWL